MIWPCCCMIRVPLHVCTVCTVCTVCVCVFVCEFLYCYCSVGVECADINCLLLYCR